MRRTLPRVAVMGATATGTLAAASGVGSLAAAAYFARLALTPDRVRPDDVLVRSFTDETITLETNAETVVPGWYGLWLSGGRGHARLGEILDLDLGSGLVTRRLQAVDYGTLTPGPARWNQYYYGLPPHKALGVPTRHVSYEGSLGSMPAWLVPAEPGPGERWAILVHGRGARREETLRAVPSLRAAGYTCLIPTYRNDEAAPAGLDGRYALGLSEWRDLDSAMRYAVAQGARELALFGWSMGGAIVLQTLNLSDLAPLVTKVVLDGPVIDWADVLEHHADLRRVPRPISALARALMGNRVGRRFVGVREAVDVARTDWVARAGELRHPMMIIHSEDDEFVPVGPSRALASERPDLVTFEPWRLARHCKEWNVDRHRWETLVRSYVE